MTSKKRKKKEKICKVGTIAKLNSSHIWPVKEFFKKKKRKKNIVTVV
jgi:hypothetical protein